MNFLLPILFLLYAAAEQLAEENWPNLIIPIDNYQPDRAFGTQFSGEVGFRPGPQNGHRIGSLVLFDNVTPVLDLSYCTIEFRTSPTGPINLGPGSSNPLQFGVYPVYGDFVNQTNTWNMHPPIGDIAYAIVTIMDGVAITNINSVPCVGGKAQFALMPLDDLGGVFDFTWFELNDPENNLFNGITYRQWK